MSSADTCSYVYVTYLVTLLNILTYQAINILTLYKAVMKKLRFLLMPLVLFFTIQVNSVYAQVTVTSSDSLNCVNPCTILRAIVVGDSPINSGITVDDIYSPIQPIGFPFNYYGTTYTSLVIGPNGTLCFDLSLAGAYDPWPITAVLLGNPSKFNNICGPWCDIDISVPDGGTITYSLTGVAPNRRYIVTYCKDRMFSCTTQITSTQIILYETSNLIEVHIATKPICIGWNSGRAIIGVQNATGTAATVAPGRDFPAAYTCTNESWRFTPNSTYTAYTVESIPYAPVPFASSSIYWYNNGTGEFLGTGATLTVCPTTTTTYKAGALGCADTSFGYYTVTPAGAFTTTLSSTNPTRCELCDGTLTISGLTAGAIDTVTYNLGGVPQPAVIATVATGGTITLTGLCAGTYDNVVVRQGLCQSLPAGPRVLTNPTISITGLSHTDPTRCGLCDGTLTISGLYPTTGFTINYNFNGVPQAPLSRITDATGRITLTGLCAGTYDNIVASYGVTCITPPAGPEIISNPPIVITSVTRIQPSVCGACDGQLIINGLYPLHPFTINYTLDGVAQPAYTGATDASGSITLADLCEGVYANIVASFSAACISAPVGPYTLAGPPPPPAIVISTTDPTECGKCDGTMRLKAFIPFSSDTFRYSLNSVVQTPFVTTAYGDSTIFLPGLCEGTYSGMSVKIGNCITTVLGATTLTAPPIDALFDTSLRLGCKGDTVFFFNRSTSTGSLSYVWDFGDGTSDTATNPYHVYGEGTFTVRLLATNGFCVDSSLMTFTLGHPLRSIFSRTPAVICQGQSVTFTNASIGASSYNWHFGNGVEDVATDPVYSYGQTGVYNVMLVAANGIPCYDTSYATVEVDTISGVSMKLTDSVLCSGTYITLTGLFAQLGNTGVQWDFGDGKIMTDVNPVKHAFDGPGTFTVKVDGYYRVCPNVSMTRTVTVIERPSIDLGGDTAICKGSNPIVLRDVSNAINPLARWIWSTGEKTSSISISAPGTYWAKVDINNCDATDSVIVKSDCFVDVPNAFTPNGDGVNDYFFPRSLLSSGLIKFSMSIFNRWGQEIFVSQTLNGSGWDGKLNGVPQPADVYVYVIDAEFKDGNKQQLKGNVTLLR